ncbi:MAG: glycosyltransferase family 2 protein [Lachnospiraceae bacterium]
MKTVDVIIPTYQPDKRFFQLIEMLQKQSYPINRIIIMNTEEAYYHQLIYGTNFTAQYHNIAVYHYSKREFDHGKTRNRGIRHSTADYFICMTQDAVPKNERLVSELVQALEQEDVAVAYGRQLAAEDCDILERFTRQYNYPEESSVKSKKDLEQLGIKTYFCSNVCAIYRRDEFDALGGFVKHAIFNEDMIFAAGVVKAGKKIAYAAKAEVIHSHNYTNLQQFHRNFDIGVSQANFPDIFLEVPSESEGIKMVRRATAYLREHGKGRLIPSLYVRSAFKLLGYQLGIHYKRLPRQIILHCTMNRGYWHR